MPAFCFSRFSQLVLLQAAPNVFESGLVIEWRFLPFFVLTTTAYMNKKGYCLYILIFLLMPRVFSQKDAYTGSWEMQYSPATASAISLQLQIFTPEKNFLYPAQLKISTQNFDAVYELLLVKKSMWHLAISKNKRPISEPPFNLDAILIVLNGGFEYSKDPKGQATLTQTKINGSVAPALQAPDSLNPEQKILYHELAQMIQHGTMRLVKKDAAQSGPPKTETTAYPRVYLGLKDTILLPSRDGVFHLSGYKPVNRKSYADSISIMQNGQMLLEQLALEKKGYGDDILLDTGMNYITLFADNFANGLPNQGRVDLQFGDLKFKMDFKDRADSGASFIVGRFYCSREKFKENSFQVYKPKVEKVLLKDERLIDRIVVTSQQLQFAIWDDATEDGDSVSIMIEGKWFVRGFPVKKNPRFLTVNLQPGPNNFVFIADNLGAIPPNTSVLEIIDGKRRKSYTMETILGEKNLIEIFYEVGAGQ